MDAYGPDGEQFAYPFVCSASGFFVTYTPHPDPRPLPVPREAGASRPWSDAYLALTTA